MLKKGQAEALQTVGMQRQSFLSPSFPHPPTAIPPPPPYVSEEPTGEFGADCGERMRRKWREKNSFAFGEPRVWIMEIFDGG